MSKVLSHSFSNDVLPPGPPSTLPSRENSLIDQYVSERIFKQKSPLCRVAMPYIIEQPEEPKKLNVKEALAAKRRKRPPPQHSPIKPHKPFKPMLNYEKTPMNEYLNYELSQEINFGLKEVKILADEIKHIKDEKRKEIMQGEEKRQNKKIRIRPTNFNRKHKHASTSCLR